MTDIDVLDLSAITPPRDRVQLTVEVIEDDGATRNVVNEYELANPEDFSAAQIHRFNAAVTEAEALWSAPKPTKADSEKLDRLYTEMTEMIILEVPPGPVARLSLIARRGVVLRFWGAFTLESFSAMGEKALGQMMELRRRTAALNASGQS
jgi:hypothetical protein